MLGTLFLFLIMALLLFAVIFFFTPQPATENKKQTFETTDWEYQKEQSKKESEAEKNKEWFSEKRWLTDKEIDWACARLKTNSMPGSFPGQELGRFKVLPAHQFHYLKEAPRNEADAYVAFPDLLSEINDNSKQLVFIPVNNPDFHWSLLVYETRTKCFYHYDTLKGANYWYVKPLFKELLQQIHQTNNPDLKQYLVKKHEIKQGNGWDCGIAVIAIIKKIIEKYQSNLEEIELRNFDFKKEREELRKEYLTTNE